MFCLLSGLGRFITEYFRVPDYDVHFAGITISAGQMLSLPLIALGIAMLIIAYRKPAYPADRAPAYAANAKTASKAK
jgi:phosphatidylglycerol:prolipoprotein diacylglycerol transferase